MQYTLGGEMSGIFKIYERISSVLKNYRNIHLHPANFYGSHKSFSTRISQRHGSCLNLQDVGKSDSILTQFPPIHGSRKAIPSSWVFLSLHSVAQLCSTLCDPMGTVAHQAPLSMGFSRQEYWVSWHFFLQGILPPQGSNLGLPHCRQILFHLSHQESSLVCSNPLPFLLSVQNPSKNYLICEALFWILTR